MIRTEALRVFVTVADCGNIRDAAARLFRTQSALSMTLKQIEDTLGAPLFETDRKSGLTDLGRYVQGVATVLLRDHDSALRLIAGYAGGHSGQLRLASVPSVAALLIPELLRDFLTARPLAEVDLVDTDSADVRRLVQTGQADIGIASNGGASAAGASNGGEGLTYTPLFQDRLKLVCRADAGFAGPLDWADLTDTALILNQTTAQIASPAFVTLAAGARLRVRNVTSLLAMVQAGVGVTLLPGLATVALPPGLVALPLADTSCTRQVGLLQRAGRSLSPLAGAFQAHLTQSIAPLARRFGLDPLG